MQSLTPAILIATVSGWLLTACASDTGAAARTIRQALTGQFGSAELADASALNPALRYLRITVNGRNNILVLGNFEPHPHGDIEVWYTAAGELLKLQNGRLVGTAGLELDWQQVQLPALPGWRAIPPEGHVYERRRDESRHRAGIRDSVLLRATPPPRKSALAVLDGTTLQWFEETTTAVAPPASKPPLPPARYAVAKSLTPPHADTVVYGEQCLSPQLCLTWQHWPARTTP